MARGPSPAGRQPRPPRAPQRRGGAAAGLLVPSTPLDRLRMPIGRSGVPGGPTVGRVGRRMGIVSVRDLLFHLPRRYDDLRELRRIDELAWVADGDVVSARVRVAELRVEPTFRRRVQRTIARLEDETGSVDATWFGRRYIERRLAPGDTIVVSGRLKHFGRRLTLDNPEFQKDDGAALLHAGRIVPVYRLTAGITSATLRRAVRGALDAVGNEYPEYLPGPMRDAALGDPSLPIGTALEEAHYPTSFEGRDAALRRLAFDELVALQLGMVGRRRARTHERGGRVVVDEAVDRDARAAIVAAIGRKAGREIELTVDQIVAIEAIRTDLAGTSPMLRLLQGDVGSGKTAVAAWALAAVASVRRQGALLAPTDLLARQHHRTLTELLEPLGIPVELLTGSLRAADAARVRDMLASGMAPVVVGTHALISEAVRFADLGLVVIDEQHRFGVDQRSALEAKAGGRVPHVLLMTATPIPRTLGQVLYADLDVTDLRTPPEGRVPIRTGIRHPDDLDRTWAFVQDEALAGRRTFVVVPLISEETTGTDDGEVLLDGGADEDGSDPGGAGTVPEARAVVAAEAEYERLQKRLAPLRVGLVHGRMKAADRDAEMARFRDGDLDVLVGTTVVEVGVDVPEASMMIVQGADRFGLAQLHQLRGRVGRGTASSYCVLVSGAAPSTEAWDRLIRGERPIERAEQARLVAVARTRDGFVLAERDWELRREGDVLGLVQSGLPSLRVASLQRESDRELVAPARQLAEKLLDDAGHLRAGHDALEIELAEGWLARVAAAEPAGAA